MTYAPHIRHLLAAMTVMAASACAPEPASAPAELRIGLLAIVEGAFAESSGYPSIRGAEMAAEEINAKGGVIIDGVPHQLTIITRGYQPRPDAAATQARSLINQERIDALVGPQLSAHAIPVGAVAETAGIPMISPMSSNPRTTADRRWVFRLAFLDDFQGEVLGRFAAEELGARSAAVLYDVSSQYSRDLAERFRNAFTRGGGAVVGEESFTADDAETFAPQLRRIAAVNPDVLFLPNHPGVDSIQMREAREFGIAATFLGSDIWDLKNLPGLPHADGAYVTHQWHRDQEGPETEAFLRRFAERYDGALPRTTAAMTYDAIRIIAGAAGAVGSLEPEALRSGIAATEAYEGVTGVISFRGSGDPIRSAVISRIGPTAVSYSRVINP